MSDYTGAQSFNFFSPWLLFVRVRRFWFQPQPNTKKRKSRFLISITFTSKHISYYQSARWAIKVSWKYSKCCELQCDLNELERARAKHMKMTTVVKIELRMLVDKREERKSEWENTSLFRRLPTQYVHKWCCAIKLEVLCIEQRRKKSYKWARK